MKRLAARLVRMNGDEARFRAAETIAIGYELIRYATRRPRWSRDRLAGQLLGMSPALNRARSALLHGQWDRADSALREHFTGRAPRFVIDPAARNDLAQTIRARHPDSVADAVARADRIAAGRYDLLGYRDLSFSSATARVDWHLDPVLQRRAPVRFWTRVPFLDARCGDHKVIWEINRHQHWLALGRAAWLTGDSRYSAVAVSELESWLASNPPLAGINWASMLELAFRSISWIWALHLFSPLDDDNATPWLVDLLGGLQLQLDHVARHLSVYFSPNTHLLGEGLALYVAGRVLPELRSAARWEQAGRAILVRESTAQINRDGGHAELSTHYHRYTLDFYLLALAVAKRTNDACADQFREVAERLAVFCRAVALDDGRLPAFGDDDGGLLFPMCGRSPADASDSLAIAASLLGRPELAVGAPPEEVLWIAGTHAASPSRDTLGQPPASRFFPDTGYAVLRSARSHAVVDVGRLGFLNGGHAHADALSLVLAIDGRPLLIDPGTATYTTDPELRDRFRSTAMHNTVVVDGRPQSMPAGPFQWDSRADAEVDALRSAAALDFVEGRHHGYDSVVHARAVVRIDARDEAREDLWVVADHILGARPARGDVYWHFGHDWTLDQSATPASRLSHPDGLWASIVSTAPLEAQFVGDTSGRGWCSPVYGRIEPAATLCFAQSGTAPYSILTAIAGGPDPVRLSIRCVPVTVDSDDGWHHAAALVRHDDVQVLAVFASPLVPSRPDAGGKPGAHAPAVRRVALPDGEFVTDGRLAIFRFSVSAGPLSLSMLDGRVAAWHGSGAFRNAVLPRAGDLHLDGTALRQLHHGADAQLVG